MHQCILSKFCKLYTNNYALVSLFYSACFKVFLYTNKQEYSQVVRHWFSIRPTFIGSSPFTLRYILKSDFR
jgi:hypothetical protein